MHRHVHGSFLPVCAWDISGRYTAALWPRYFYYQDRHVSIVQSEHLQPKTRCNAMLAMRS